MAVKQGGLVSYEPYITTTVQSALGWARKNSLWPLPFGTACCAIEFMGAVGSYFDISRFGAELVRFSPRQADLLIVSGTVVYKMAPVLRKIYAQMADPKWVISMGVCASSGGFYDDYCTLQGIDQVIPVDIYVPGCPPTPDLLLDGLVKLQKKIDADRVLRRAERTADAGTGSPAGPRTDR